ncbi:hypothetical protein CQ12_37475 [Bradyrhizobium jicamae]|uniref:Uncharacterized protein n=1 Tax=Bradyrhizobium jicamae TaxID=280332 RepID=A0A0R3KFU1_9BRAD|nr:hypothetical protein CQ12_37475 [Bradyrhizobium jicamae]
MRIALANAFLVASEPTPKTRSASSTAGSAQKVAPRKEFLGAWRLYGEHLDLAVERLAQLLYMCC